MATHDVVDPSTMPEWERKLYDKAKQMAANEKSPGQFFTTKSGILAFNGIPLPNNEMDVVLTAVIHENVYYVEKFNADKITAPVCYAFGPTGPEGMKPHAESHDPQSPTCATCERNKWQQPTTPGGKSPPKECKNMRRLALIPAGYATTELLAKAPIGFLRIPVTSVKHYGEYLKVLQQSGKNILTVVTKVKLSPDPRTMVRFDFTYISDVTDRGVLEQLAALNERSTEELQAPYPKYETATAPAYDMAAQDPTKRKFA